MEGLGWVMLLASLLQRERIWETRMGPRRATSRDSWALGLLGQLVSLVGGMKFGGKESVGV